MKRWSFCTYLFCTCLLLGGALRFVGLERGGSDFVLAEERGAGVAEAFYAFHPDERMVIESALAPVDGFKPPLTVYGLLPLYLLRGTLEICALVGGWETLNLDAPQDVRRIYHVARVLAALYSIGVLGVVWILGRRYFGERQAILGVICVSFAAGAIQQAHFYIVDGPFVLLSTAGMWATLRALEGETRRWYVAAGLLIGLTGAVRLNGLLLGVVLLVGYMVCSDESWRHRWHRLWHANLWVAGLVSALTLVVLEPYLVMDSSWMWRSDSLTDFGLAVKVVRGELLQLWLLADWHTTPYVHHWTHLWPLAVGWPLTIFFLGALGYVGWRRNGRHLLILLWCILYFGIVGGLVAKSVRYIIPLLPFLALFAGALLVRLWDERRWVGAVATGVVVGYTIVYGVAFAGVYAVEDSRIRAGRWIEDNLPPGSAIAVERGGFPMRSLISQQTYRLQAMDINALFGMRGYATCEMSRYYLQRRLELVDYLTIIDANRYAQFIAVPDLYPAVASFYQRLVAGELGFTLVRRFKNYPSLLGMEFKDDGAEPSFIGYEHPAVLVFKKNERFAQDWSAWDAALKDDVYCGADGAIAAVAAAVRAGDKDRALELVKTARAGHPHMLLTWLIEGDLYQEKARSDSLLWAQQHYLKGYADPALQSYLLPWASAMSLALLGLDDLAQYILAKGAQMEFLQEDKRSMVEGYVYTARIWEDSGEVERANEVYKLTTQLYPRTDVINVLGQRAAAAHHYDEALHWWKMSLQLDPAQKNITHRVAALQSQLNGK